MRPQLTTKEGKVIALTDEVYEAVFAFHRKAKQ